MTPSLRYDSAPYYDAFLGSDATPLYLYRPEDRAILEQYRDSELKVGIALTWDEHGAGLLFAGEGVEVPEGVKALVPYAKKIWEATQTGPATGLLRSLGAGSPRLIQPAVELWVSKCGRAVKTIYTQPVLLSKVLEVARGL